MEPEVKKIVREFVFKLGYVHRCPEKMKILQTYLCRHTFSGTLYRKSVSRTCDNLHKGDIIDYSKRITSWSTSYDKCIKFKPDGMFDDEECNPDTAPIYKLDSKNMLGKDITDINPEEAEVLLAGGIKLVVTDVVGRLYTLELVT